jgi:hypothetical protein
MLSRAHLALVRLAAVDVDGVVDEQRAAVLPVELLRVRTEYRWAQHKRLGYEEESHVTHL